jgi:hypothetical protein
MHQFRLASLALISAATAALAPAQGSARVVGGSLRIDAGPGSVRVKVTVDQRGAAQVFDVPGLPSPIDFTGVRAIDYRSGPGPDQLQFEVMTAASFPVSIVNPSGETILDLKYRVLPTSARVDLRTFVVCGDGADLLQYEAVSHAQDVGATLVAVTGEGETDLFAKVDSPDPSQRLDVRIGALTGSAQDDLVLDIVSNARFPSIEVAALGGAGRDLLDLAIDQKSRAQVLLGLFGDLGDGNDLTDLRLSGSLATYGQYGSLAGGRGDDNLKLFVDTDLVSIGTLDGAAGRDLVEVLVTGALDGLPTLAGGDGDDLLDLSVEGRRGGAPTLDGGEGFDVGFGYGRFISVESIN